MTDTPEQMRMEIARLKGWKPTAFVMLVSGRLVGTSPEGRFYATVPDWPASIEAAWELVEEMRRSGCRVKIVLFPPKPKDEIPANQFVFVNKSNPYTIRDLRKHSYLESDYFEKSDEILIAICAAYIAWKKERP
jgi:hypothetical protein